MTICLVKSCSFGLLCVSFVSICQFVCVRLEGRLWDSITLVLDKCLSVYFAKVSSHVTDFIPL